MSGLDHKSNNFKSGLNKIKAFLLRQRWKEALIFFAFVLLSLGFWMMQSLQEEYEMEISFPVKYKNIPVDIVFDEPLPEKITARVKDKGSVLINYSFAIKFSPIDINFRTKTEQTDESQLLISQKELETDIQRQLIASSSLISFEPHQINLKHSKRAHKEIPVFFHGNINLEPGFQISGDIQINPAVVSVYASKATLDSLQVIETASTEIKKVNKTVTKAILLQKIQGVAFDPETVTITVPVDEFSEKVLEVPVQCVNIPPKYTVRLLPNKIKVSSRIPLSRFKELQADQFEISIPFDDLEQNLSGIHPVKLTKQPDWIQGVSLSPNKIEFIIEQNKTDD